ncbi:MAG: hypothetical protein MUO67_10400 [Anaerolineales bacterium]|nr:hypothetical protein [Anaerolineales bacterium]
MSKKYLSEKRPFWKFLFILGLALFLCINMPTAQASPLFFSAVSNASPVIDQPFNISTGTIDEDFSAVAYNPVDKEYLVLWHNDHPNVTDDIYAQRISERGEFLSWFYVADGLYPRVAFNPKNNTYLVVYMKWASTDYDVYAQRVDYNGPLGIEFLLANNLDEDETYPAVAYNTHASYDEFLVVWENEITTPLAIQKIEGIRVAGAAGGGDLGGETVGGRIGIADDGNFFSEPDIAYNLNMNEYLVVFTRQASGGGAYDVYGRKVTGIGAVLGTDPINIDSSADNQHKPAVAAYRLDQDTPYLVVFNDFWNDTTGDVRGYLLNKDAQPMQLVNIATTPMIREFDPAIAHSETWGGYVVTWAQGPSGDIDIFSRQVSSIGLTKPEFDISGFGSAPLVCDRGNPAIALGQTSALSVWTDPCGSAGGLDILGRMLSFQIYLPLIIR